MTPSLPLQYLLIGLAVLFSLWVVANKQFPAAVRRARVALALPLLREGRGDKLRALGKWIAPRPKNSAGACGGCDNCGPTPPAS